MVPAGEHHRALKKRQEVAVQMRRLGQKILPLTLQGSPVAGISSRPAEKLKAPRLPSPVARRSQARSRKFQVFLGKRKVRPDFENSRPDL